MYTLEDLFKECAVVCAIGSGAGRYRPASRVSTKLKSTEADVSARFYNSVDSMDEHLFLRVWQAIMEFSYEHLALQKGVTIPKFCTFTFAKDSDRAPGGSGNFPVFRLSAKNQQLQNMKTKFPPPVKIMPEEAVVAVNLAKIAAMCSIDKDVVKSAVAHLFTRISEVILENHVVSLEFDRIGVLQARNGIVDFRFNIGGAASGSDGTDFNVGDGNPSFMAKAPASALGLKLEGLASAKYAEGEALPELPPEPTPRTIAKMDAEAREKEYRAPGDFASSLRRELEKTEIALDAERAAFKAEVLSRHSDMDSVLTSDDEGNRKIALRNGKRDDAAAASARSSGSLHSSVSRNSRPKTSAVPLPSSTVKLGASASVGDMGIDIKSRLHLDITKDRIKETSPTKMALGFKGAMHSSRLPGIINKPEGITPGALKFSVNPVYVNPILEPPRGRKVAPIQFAGAQSKAYDRLQQNLLDECGKLEEEELELAKRRNVSEAIYQERVLRRKKAQEQINTVLATQVKEKNGRDEETWGLDRAEDPEHGRAYPISHPKTKKQITAEKNALSSMLHHQMNDKERRKAKQEKLGLREDNFFIHSVQTSLEGDRKYKAAKKAMVKEELLNEWTTQSKFNALTREIEKKAEAPIRRRL